jgi:hypothetical protein
LHFGAQLLSIIGIIVAEQQQDSPDGSGGSNRGGLQEAAWEAMAAMPIMATLLQDTLRAAARAEPHLSVRADSLDRQCSVVAHVFKLLPAAEPLQLPSPKYLATWAAAADAALRMVPALIEQGGDSSIKLAGMLAGLLWQRGCEVVHDWAAAIRGTDEHKIAWAAAKQPLAAAHMRACRLVQWLDGRPEGAPPLNLAKLLWCLDGEWQRLSKLLIFHSDLWRLAAEAGDGRHAVVRCARGFVAVVVSHGWVAMAC